MTRRSGREEWRARSNAKVARMLTNFSYQNVTIEPHFCVSRTSASSPKSFIWPIQRYYNYTRNFVVLQESFLKSSRLTRRFIPIAKTRGLLGGEDKSVAYRVEGVCEGVFCHCCVSFLFLRLHFEQLNYITFYLTTQVFFCTKVIFIDQKKTNWSDFFAFVTTTH